MPCRPLAVLREVAPLAVLREVAPLAVLREVAPLAVLREVAPLAILRQVAPLAVLREVAPLAVLREIAPLAVLREVAALAILREVAPLAVLREVAPIPPAVLHTSLLSISEPSVISNLEDLALEAVDSLKKVHGLTFRVGRLSDFYGFKLSGTEIDWAKSSAQIKYSYTPELRPAKKSEGGFQAPTSFIIPSGEEVFAAVVTCCRHIAWEWERGM
ncbi:hypothetical protein LSAT2_032676 [Lamellibrachia satsuma]|nr:hypothetical protein LSAT2_032676 [Lamellibrachia satsuma]